MSKLSARKRMKSSFLDKKMIDIELASSKAGSIYPSVCFSTKAVHFGLMMMIARTPASLFRCDKPDLDQRRVKRYASKGRVFASGTTT